jgi:hypothetical protein
MKREMLLIIAVATLCTAKHALAQGLDHFYKLGPDSLEQEGVPHGRMVGPLRLFFQDGRNDNRGVRRGGEYDPRRDWFLQNVRLVEALTKKGYDVNFVWGIGLHGQKQGGAILPDMMRWLWRDHPLSVDVKDQTARAFHRPAAQVDEPRQEDTKSQPRGP